MSVFLLALAPEILPAQSFWQVYANTHTNLNGINSLVVDGNGFIMGSNSNCYIVSKDNGAHWQSSCFPILVGYLCEPVTGSLILWNGCVYTDVTYDCSSNTDAFLIKYNELDTTWIAASVDFIGYLSSAVGDVTILKDSELFYISTKGLLIDTSWIESVGLHCITPTRIFDPFFHGIDLSNILCLASNSSVNLFASTDIGVYITSDDGTNWSNNDKINNNAFINLIGTSSGNLYGVTSTSFLYLSTNNGSSWQFLNSELQGYSLGVFSTCKGVIIGSIFEDIGVGETINKIYMLVDNGTHWQQVNYGILDTTKQYALAADSAGYVYAAADSIIYRTASPLTGVSEYTVQILPTTELEQNYPNPFSSQTEISFSLPESEHAAMKIYNTLGQCVATPVNEQLFAGRHSVSWNANALPSGVYFYQLQTPFQQEMKTMYIAK